MATADELRALAAAFDVDKGPGATLRFEEAIVAGQRGYEWGGYEWGGVQTGCVKAMRLMNAAWNNRKTIAAALLARAAQMEANDG